MADLAPLNPDESSRHHVGSSKENAPTEVMVNEETQEEPPAVQRPHSVPSSNSLGSSGGASIANFCSVNPDKMSRHYDGSSKRTVPTEVIVNDHTQEEPPVMQRPHSVLSSNPAESPPARASIANFRSVNPDKRSPHYDGPSKRTVPTEVIVNDHTQEEPPVMQRPHSVLSSNPAESPPASASIANFRSVNPHKRSPPYDDPSKRSVPTEVIVNDHAQEEPPVVQHPHSVPSSNPARSPPGASIANFRSMNPYKRSHHYDVPSKRNVPTEVIGRLLPASDWMVTIKRNLEAAGKDNADGSWSPVSIYKIPDYLINPSDHKAYIPQVVSLGPYHHGKTPPLQQMERHKWRALQRVLERTHRDIEHYLDSMKELENEARACYAELPEEKPTSNEFVEMMLLDGCFILEILQGAVVGDGFKTLGYAGDDPVFSMRGTMNFIKRDMIMLENQIPLFVLDKVRGLQIEKESRKGYVAKLAISFFGPLMRGSPAVSHHLKEGNLHCLEVFRESLLYEQTDPQDPSDTKGSKKRQQQIHYVTELKDAGIKFRKPKTTVYKLMDIKFENGILYIPPILIDDGTKSLLFNLMAFEHCHLIFRKDITTYVIFLDNLINTAEDVKYLRKHGIIEHWLGSDGEVADLINRLGKEVVFPISDSYLSKLSEDINIYYERTWNAWRATWNIWRATLKEKYFNNPWAIISFVAAVLLLILTAAQAFYAVYSYYWPHN